jgi:hypothetical protein
VPTSTRKRPKSRSKSARRPIKPKLTAATADKYDLYQRAVQDPEFELPWLADVYRELRGKEPLHLREDFAGTALSACTWVAGHPERSAEAYDLDAEVLEWGRRHNLQALGESARRVRLIQADVRRKGRPADILCAHNFSYNIFRTRKELLQYLRAAKGNLAADGMLSLDMYGGTEAHEPIEEERWVDDQFVYVWDQDEHFPGTHEHRCFIHFRFPDGSRIDRAFQYDWRLWTMPELKDAMAEVGFSRVLSYFETYDEDGDATGDFEMNERGWAAEGWLAYVIGLK